MMPPDYLRQPQSGTTVSTNRDVTANGNQGGGVSFSNNDTSLMARRSTITVADTTPCRNRKPPAFRCGSGRETAPPSHPRYVKVHQRKGQAVFPSAAWGEPVANFPMFPDYCDYYPHFNAQRIVFDLTFCGDWAGAVWPQSSCASLADTCVDVANEFPSSFSEAYWTINSIA